jgi:hypothetical protein
MVVTAGVVSAGPVVLERVVGAEGVEGVRSTSGALVGEGPSGG